MGETPRLSPSIANILLTRSPLHAWGAHRLLGQLEREATDAQRNGSLLDALLLGREARIVEAPFDNWRTDKAKEFRDDPAHAGKIVVKSAELAAARNTAQTIMARINSLGILLSWEQPRRLEWESIGVLCSGEIDGHAVLSTDDVSWIAEVKTTDNAHPMECRKSIERYGYHVQGAAYQEATGKPVLFLFAETEGVCDVTPFELTGSLLELGQRRWERAKATWKACLSSGVWPGAAGGKIVQLPATDFALVREEDEIDSNV
jgi:hypothetical protein